MTNIFSEYNKSYDKIDSNINHLEANIIDFNEQVTLLYNNLVDDISNGDYDQNTVVPDNATITSTLHNLQTLSNNINDTLKNDISNSNMTENLYEIGTEMDNIQLLLVEYEHKQNLLNDLLRKYNLTVQNYGDTNTNRSYYVMFIWFILLLFVLYVVFISFTDRNNELDIMSQILFLTCYFILLYLLFRYLFSYFREFKIIFN